MNAQIDDQPGIAHQLGDLADAADVLDAVGVGEAEIAVEPVPDIVAVEQHRVRAERQQLLFETVGDRRFAGAGQPGEPQDRGLRGRSARRVASGRRSRSCQWMLVARRSAKAIIAGRRGLLREAVDQDEAAGRRGSVL